MSLENGRDMGKSWPYYGQLYTHEHAGLLGFNIIGLTGDLAVGCANEGNFHKCGVAAWPFVLFE
jgi:hypothetical protein